MITVPLIYQYIIINVNPHRDFTTNKLSILNYISDKYKPKSEYYNPKKKYTYPFILKPVCCTGYSNNVKLISNSNELNEYLQNNNINETMYQEFIDSEYEVGLLYERNPLAENGKIISIVMRTFLHRDKFNIFDFNQTSNDFVNLDYLITPKLTSIIDNISHQIPNFYVGRYDIRFYNIEDFKNGKFFILEVNGQMGFDLKKNCYKYSYLNLYVWIWIKLRWLLVRLYYGLINIIMLNSFNINIIFILIYNFIKCSHVEKLFTL